MKRWRIKTDLKSRRAASATEYALVVGLIAVGAIAAVAVSGDRVAGLFQSAGNKVAASTPGASPADPAPGGTTDPAPLPPTASVQSSAAVIRSGETTTFSWETAAAETITARYTLSGNCAEIETSGAGPHALSWTGANGQEDVAWTAALAGCGMVVEIIAANDAGEARPTASTVFESADVTPESLAFAPTGGVDPGGVASSNPATVEDITASATIASSADDVRISLANDPGRAKSLTVAPGTSIQLHADAPDGFAQTRSVPFTAGGLSGAWLITTRQRDTEAVIGSLGSDALGLDQSATRQSLVAATTNFDGPLTLTITRSTTAPSAGTLRYSRNGGSYTALGGTNPTELAVDPEDTIQLQYVAPSSYQATSADITTTLSLGTPTTTETWRAGIRAGRSCPAKPVTFVGMGGAVCNANLPLTLHSRTASADDATGDTQGRATYRCSDGTWVPPTGNDCLDGQGS